MLRDGGGERRSIRSPPNSVNRAPKERSEYAEWKAKS